MSLKFFNKLSATLEIELSEPPEPISEKLINLKAKPETKIESVKLSPQFYENDDFRDLTEEELDRIVINQPEIQLQGFGDAVTHPAPNKAYFTVRDLFQAIEETELRTRHQSDWFEGIDVHHIFFEGIELNKDDVWEINWGS